MLEKKDAELKKAQQDQQRLALVLQDLASLQKQTKMYQDQLNALQAAYDADKAHFEEAESRMEMLRDRLKEFTDQS